MSSPSLQSSTGDSDDVACKYRFKCTFCVFSNTRSRASIFSRRSFKRGALPHSFPKVFARVLETVLGVTSKWAATRASLRI